jgi:catechol 2,3-dioxygenase-like lactoylglutathione lyase family enzyme
MLEPIGLTRGHYECRSFAETLPILAELLALEPVAEENGKKILKHPNTAWRLCVHEGGPSAPIKPMRNHYGVRVATHEEVDRAYQYLERRKRELRVTILKPRENHNAYSLYFHEPGGNFWEIESYEKAVEAGLGKTASPHWTAPLPEERFRGRGYVPQALTHGTIESDDVEASERFYREALGLEIVKLWRSSLYVKHPATPWYVVCLQGVKGRRVRLGPRQRFTLALESADAVRRARREFERRRGEWRLSALEELQRVGDDLSFLLADLDGNWWEITSARE